MITKQIFEKALNVEEPWYLENITFDENKKRLDIYINFKKGSVFHYESTEEKIKGNFKAYDTKDKVWRHLNFFEHECYLHARVPRVEVSDKTIRLIHPPWEGVNSGFTLLFEALVLQLAMHMPVHTVSKIIKESDSKIWRVLEKYVDQTLFLNDYKNLHTIGMDETSVKKGHDYITLFVDMLKKRTVFIAEGKDAATVKAFTEDIKKHNGIPEAIKDVSCDMSPAFIKGVKDELPEAKITFDKFHIMKIINKAVNEVRKQELAINPILKDSRYVLLKNEPNLTKKQQEKREELSMPKLNLKSIRALHIRENFQDIYKAETDEHFELLLKKWYFWATHSRIEQMKQAAYTIKNHWEGVLQWKKSQINNGLLEGLNSLIQAAKAKARGFKIFRYFRIVAFLITGKLNFNKLNTSYLPT
ncbi:MAG: ISL3 family transposase [Nanoarchaeota archaeon]|nr:ISL3 family transposase [Nanoarchaeota archaeon]